MGVIITRRQDHWHTGPGTQGTGNVRVPPVCPPGARELRQGPWPSRTSASEGMVAVRASLPWSRAQAMVLGYTRPHVHTSRAGRGLGAAQTRSLQEPLRGQSRHQGPGPCCAGHSPSSRENLMENKATWAAQGRRVASAPLHGECNRSGGWRATVAWAGGGGLWGDGPGWLEAR